MIIIALPESGFDPTECIAPWMILKEKGFEVHFATPKGVISKADSRMIQEGFGPLSCCLMTHPYILEKYPTLVLDAKFKKPLSYEEINPNQCLGIIIPGGHGSKMKSLLNSSILQNRIASLFSLNKPVGAICTGVLAIANSIDPSTNKSVLYGRKTTAVTKLMELTGWLMTYPWLKNYFRLDTSTIQDLVCQKLAKKSDFLTGPFPLYPMRFSEKHCNRQFVVKDGNYLSARWPGDAYRFSHEFLQLLLNK